MSAALARLRKRAAELEQKKQFKQYKARVEALPEPHRTAAKAFER